MSGQYLNQTRTAETNVSIDAGSDRGFEIVVSGGAPLPTIKSKAKGVKRLSVASSMMNTTKSMAIRFKDKVISKSWVDKVRS